MCFNHENYGRVSWQGEEAASSGCALSTTEMLYNKNDPLWPWAEAKIHQHLPQRGCDHLSFCKC